MPWTETDTSLQIDRELLTAILDGTSMGIQVTGTTPAPVGAARSSSTPGEVSVIVGLVGKSHGSVTVALSERGMLHLAGSLLCEEKTEADEQVYDAIVEVGKRIAGSIRDILSSSELELRHLSAPSLVLGSRHDVHHTRGTTNASVTFELDEIPRAMPADRYLTVTVSLLRPSA